MSRYADLHFHPAHSAYNKVRFSEEEKDPLKNHPWNIPDSDLKKQKKGKQGFKYNQCDFAKCAESGVRLAFASLYPIEKGFFFGRGGRVVEDLTKKKKEKDGEFNFFDLLGAITKTLGYAFPIESIISNIGLDFIQALSMRFHYKRVQHIQSGEYDYYYELKKEYKFYQTRDGKQETAHLQLTKDSPKKNITGQYDIVKDKIHLTNLLNTDSIAVILTIEGMHSLGIGNIEKEHKDISEADLIKRIRELKGLEGDVWKHPILFMTFSHHFNNNLCGHAHSLPKMANLIMDQKVNMDEGIIYDGGYDGLKIMRRLLGLDDQNKDDGTPRILIDVKHMSARGRTEYYEKIAKPYNAKAQVNGKAKIPVIASHVGFSGHITLADQIKTVSDNKEKDNFKIDGFYAWNINICVEDVEIIHASEGLIGMSFDQRILGVDKRFLFFNLTNKRKNNMYRFRRLIENIVAPAFQENWLKKDDIWKRICIGSDFEGFVDPINAYPSVMDYPQFELDLNATLEDLKKDKPEYFLVYNVDTIVKGIIYENAEKFALTHIQ